jgi:hypothetical protein
MSARCNICDWSPSNKQSLFNPKVETIGYNKLYIDNKTGDTTCILCIDAIHSSVGAYLMGFKEIAHDDRRATSGIGDEDSGIIHWSDLPESEMV